MPSRRQTDLNRSIPHPLGDDSPVREARGVLGFTGTFCHPPVGISSRIPEAPVFPELGWRTTSPLAPVLLVAVTGVGRSVLWLLLPCPVLVAQVSAVGLLFVTGWGQSLGGSRAPGWERAVCSGQPLTTLCCDFAPSTTRCPMG